MSGNSKKKRGADSYLTDQNWNEEDDEEEEDVGIFRKASEDILAKRTYKKATRRVNNNEKNKISNPFAAFGGFASSKVSSDEIKQDRGDNETASPFSTSMFNAKTSEPYNVKLPTAVNSNFREKRTDEKIFSNTIVNNKETKSVSNDDTLENSKDLKSEVTENKAETTDDDSQENTTKTGEDNEMDDKYFTQLASLNVCVLDWIKTHIDENSCIDLTPVFNDYEKHLQKLST